MIKFIKLFRDLLIQLDIYDDNIENQMRDKRKCKKEGRTCNLTRKNGNASSKEEEKKTRFT